MGVSMYMGALVPALVPAGPAIPGYCPGYFESCVLISRGPDAKTRGHQHIACACTDVRIAYSVVTKYAFCNCASNAVMDGWGKRRKEKRRL